MMWIKREIEKDTWRGRQRIIEAEKNAKEQLLVVVFHERYRNLGN